MRIRTLFGTTALGVMLAVTPLGQAAIGSWDSAFAKGGNGNGGGGGNGHGDGGNHGSAKADHAQSDHDQSDDDSSGNTTSSTRASKDGSLSLDSHRDSRKATKAADAAKSRASAASFGALNSLKRDYHAYLNSKDPKMAALSAYVKAYAEFEIENGRNAVPTDPALSDNSLRSALQQLSNKPVTDQTLASAKTVLGLSGTAGKIDQVRDALEKTTTTTTTTVDSSVTVDPAD